MAMYTIYTGFTEFRNHILCIHRFESLSLIFFNLNFILILDIVDQNKMYLFASKGTKAAYLNLDLQLYQGVQPFQKLFFKNELL